MSVLSSGACLRLHLAQSTTWPHTTGWWMTLPCLVQSNYSILGENVRGDIAQPQHHLLTPESTADKPAVIGGNDYYYMVDNICSSMLTGTF